MIKRLILIDVKRVMRDKLNLRNQNILLSSKLELDLSIESWGRTLLFMEIERSYDITFTFNEICVNKIVADVVDIIYKKLMRIKNG